MSLPRRGRDWNAPLRAHRLGHLVPRPAVESSSGALLEDAAPLLEEERYVIAGAVVADFPHPFDVHGSCAWTGLAADDDPGHSLDVNIAYRAEERLYGEEASGERGVLQMPNSCGGFVVLDGYAAPDMLWSKARSVSAAQVVSH